MIKAFFLSALAAFSFASFAPEARAEPVVGAPAPAFSAVDSHGKTHTLSDYAGKVVVLEWTNHECPFVAKYYNSSAMQKLQETYTAKDVVWLTVNSGAEGKQGHRTPEQANAIMEKQGFKSTAYLLDTNGALGKAYDAKTTPHMFVINSQGVLVYDGAIDDNDSARIQDVATAHNYVKAALDSLLAGEAIEAAKTRPYGCTVKY